MLLFCEELDLRQHGGNHTLSVSPFTVPYSVCRTAQDKAKARTRTLADIGSIYETSDILKKPATLPVHDYQIRFGPLAALLHEGIEKGEGMPFRERKKHLKLNCLT